MEKQRMDWLDQLKGIAIILVLLGHTFVPALLNKGIYSFHMPLFFMISGFCFVPEKASVGVKIYLIKKIKGLMCPYFFFALTNYVFWLIGKRWANSGGVDAIEMFKGILFPIRGAENATVVNALWFIPCLLCVEIICYLVCHLLRNSRNLPLFLIGGGVLLVEVICGQYLPGVYSLDLVPVGCFFYVLGCWVRSQMQKKIFALENRGKSITIILIFVWIIAAFTNTPISMFDHNYGNLLRFLLAASCGSAALLMIAKSVSVFYPLVWVGKNSVVYLGMHQMIVFSTMDRILNVLNIKNPYIGTCIKMIVAIVSISIAAYFLERWFPWILGRRVNGKTK